MCKVVKINSNELSFKQIIDVVGVKPVKVENRIEWNGKKFIVAFRKPIFRHNQIKTNYLHIFIVDGFETKNILQHWRECKDGSFQRF